MTQTEFTQRVLAMQDRLYRVSCTLLCCEADREDAVHRHAVHFIQPRNAMGEHTGLAGACTGQHKVMPGRSGNRFALRGV